MDRTPFAGLTALIPGDALESDGASFLYRNPHVIDFLLELGVMRHRHNAHPALAVPTLAPAVAQGSGGALPTDTTYFVGYTLIDEYGGETTVSPIAEITTRAGLGAPDGAPTATFQAASGPMPGGTYYYAITVVDTAGGESMLGDYAFVDVDYGLASGRVVVSGLAALLGGGASWRLYRSFNGAEWGFLAAGTTDTYVDDCSACVDATLTPPVNAPTTGDSRLEITVPMASAGVSSFRVYASLDGDLASPSLVGSYPVASGGQTIVVTDANFGIGSPPPVSLAMPGANQIDPDTDILDWHWKRPVAGSAALGSGAPGDVRLAIDSNTLYAVGSAGASAAAGWTPVSGGPKRKVVNHTATLGSGATEAPNIVAPALSWQLLRIAANRPTRIRLYATRAQRDADALRVLGTDPDSGVGLLAEVVTTGAIAAVNMSPGAVGANMEVTPVAEIPANITNLDTASGAVSVDLTLLPLES